MPTRHGGSLAKNANTSLRLSLRATTILPSASTPWIWNTFFARSSPTSRPDWRGNRWRSRSRAKGFCGFRVYDDAGPACVLRYRHTPCCLLWDGKHRHPELGLRRSIPRLRTPLRTLRARPRGQPCITRGRCGSLRLHPDGSTVYLLRSPGAPVHLISVGCAGIPILARSINAPHQRSDTLMQLSRSPLNIPPCDARPEENDRTTPESDVGSRVCPTGLMRTRSSPCACVNERLRRAGHCRQSRGRCRAQQNRLGRRRSGRRGWTTPASGGSRRSLPYSS